MISDQTHVSLNQAVRQWNADHPRKMLLGKDPIELKTAGLGKSIFAVYQNNSWKFVRLNCFKRILLCLGIAYKYVKLNAVAKETFLNWRSNTSAIKRLYLRTREKINTIKGHVPGLSLAAKTVTALEMSIVVLEEGVTERENAIDKVNKQLKFAKQTLRVNKAKFSLTNTEAQIVRAAIRKGIKLYNFDNEKILKEESKLLAEIVQLEKSIKEFDEDLAAKQKEMEAARNELDSKEKALEEERKKMLAQLEHLPTAGMVANGAAANK